MIAGHETIGEFILRESFDKGRYQTQGKGGVCATQKPRAMVHKIGAFDRRVDSRISGVCQVGHCSWDFGPTAG